MWHFKLKCDIALNENSQMSLTDSLVIFELRGKLLKTAFSLHPRH